MSLHGQCLDLLVLMLDRPGQLITREEIRRILWPDSNVDFEHSLDVLVSRLRTALGDTSKTARYIQTVPRKGYRFVEQVRFKPSGCEATTSVSWTRSFARYVAVAVLAALIAVVIANTHYQKFVPPHPAPALTPSR